MNARLITIPISHYCERARWALEHCQVEFEEERHLQVLHRRSVKRAGADHSVPVLVSGDQCLADSADIVAFADSLAPAGRRLYPDDSDAREKVEALERELAGAYGVSTRVLGYDVVANMPGVFVRRYNNAGAPASERLLFRLGYPLAKRFILRVLEVTSENVQRCQDLVAGTLDDVAARLDDGRPFLMGEQFTAADLTFAAMSAPLVLAPEYGVPLPEPAQLAPTLRDRVDEYRRHPAGQYALRIYREHR
jgi:glutathione S-transferase